MRYSFLPMTIPYGELLFVIVTDKSGTDEVLPNRYVRSIAPPVKVIEETLGEVRVGEMRLDMFDKARKFRDEIFDGITEAQLLCTVKSAGVESALFHGSIDLESDERNEGENEVSIRGYDMLSVLRAKTVEDLYIDLDASGKFISHVVANSFIPTGELQEIVKIDEILKQILSYCGVSALTYETSWSFGWSTPAPSAMLADLYVPRGMFSDDLSNESWSWKRFETVGQLLAELQKQFFAYTILSIEPVSGNISATIRERMLPTAIAVEPVGRMKSHRIKKRQTEHVIVNPIFPSSREKVIESRFDVATIAPWVVIPPTSNITIATGSPGYGGEGHMLWMGQNLGYSSFIGAVGMTIQGGYYEKVKIELRKRIEGTATDPVGLHMRLRVYNPITNDATTLFDIPYEGMNQWHSWSVETDGPVSIIYLEVDGPVQLGDAYVTMLFDDIVVTYSGRIIEFDKQYGSVILGSDKAGITLDVPFLFDVPNNNEFKDVVKADSGRFLYLYNATWERYQAVTRGRSVVSPMFSQFNAMVAWFYWSYFGGLRRIHELVYHKITATAGGLPSPNAMQLLSKIAVGTYAEVIQVSPDPVGNEMQITAIDKLLQAP